MTDLLAAVVRRRAGHLALIALILLLGASHWGVWVQDLTRTVSGVPSIAFVPPGSARQIAVICDVVARRLRRLETE